MIKTLFKKCLILAISVSPLTGFAEGRLPFYDQEPPVFNNPNVKSQIKMICYTSYCSEYMPMLRVPVAVGEYLTADGLAQARYQSRKGYSFYADPSLAPDQRAELSDYKGSGYDRGHMAPWADNADPSSFSLVNIVPQDAWINRNVWEHIEAKVRSLAVSYGRVFVVTGPLFKNRIELLNKRVAIPTGYFKAIFIPSTAQSAFYYVNVGDRISSSGTILELNKMAHMNVFPFVSASDAVEKAYPLPVIE